MVDLSEALHAAAEAARVAGDFQRVHFSEDNDSSYKAPSDPVSEIDHESERLILERLSERFPSHAILSEESGETGGGDVRWIVDPLDGTSNYLRNLPDFCISIALEVDGRPQVGIVYRPMSEDMYGASLEGDRPDDCVPLEPATTASPESALVSIPYSTAHTDREAVWKTHQQFGSRIEGVRSTGSGALDLAYVAAGITDAACGFDQSVWDRAAGQVLIEAAGGEMTDHAGDPDHEGDFLASNGSLHDTFLEFVES